MRLRDRLQSSIRTKLLSLVLLPLAVVLPLLIAILALWGGAAYDRLLIYKIRSDLAVADGYFERVKDGVGSSVAMLAGSSRLARALADGDRPAVNDFLEATKQSLRVDFLHFVDPQGRVLASSDRLAAGFGLGARPAVRGALEGRATTVLDVFTADHLAAIHPELRARARVPLVATRNAAPSERREEDRGMVIHAAAPVYDAGGGLAGALVGGLLLNRNLAFVDRINEIIYPQGALPFGSHGTVTLFLDDVRIATNVRLFQDERAEERAIGTRVSAAVRQAVLDRGETWRDRAFVVNDWYVSAYEPLTDSRGERIGMLYVGYLEAPFRAIKHWALAGVVGVFALAILLASVLSVAAARGIFRPLERMNETMHAIEAGDGAARVGSLPSRDEIGQLAAHFDRLLDRLNAQNEELRRWGEQLDAKVAERTAALEDSNLSLRQAQRKLAMSEKLAAIGELTAGVAHEINNPVAVIQGNLDVLREVLGDAAAPVRPEMRLMDDQVERIRLIVAKLLQFARPAEYVGYLEAVRLDLVVQDSLVLVGHQMKKGHIAVVQHHRATRPVTVNRNELQQVLINLMVNALHAMPDGGTLSIASGDRDEAGVAGAWVSVADTGPGIAAVDRERLFMPFFTTKTQGGGTGLGLWVSLSLVERYGGRIGVDCPAAGGAVFTVWLPTEPAAPLQTDAL